MAKELQPIDITDVPDVLRLAEEVRTSRVPRLLKRGDQDVAILSPVEASPSGQRFPRRRERRTGPDDPLWQIIGIGDAAASPEEPTDVSENKYKYLADA